jgi:hypothetical protein
MSWRLVRQKLKEFENNKLSWGRCYHHMIDRDDAEAFRDAYVGCNVLLWDECSMMTEFQRQKITAQYANHKHIFCGDLGYQLPPPSLNGKIENEIDVSWFKQKIHHSENHRCKCPILMKILTKLREFIKSKKSKQFINKYVIDIFTEFNRITNKKDLQASYKIDDYILVSINKYIEEYDKLFTGKFETEKYFITGKNRLLSKGDIVISKDTPKMSVVRHAFTVHSVQGETAEKMLYIDTRRLFCNRMIYTALSRARTIEQIMLIIPDEQEPIIEITENIPVLEPLVEGLVYQLTCNITGQIYYGSTLNMTERIKSHESSSNKCRSKLVTARGDYSVIILHRIVASKKKIQELLELTESGLILNNPCVNLVAPHTKNWR